MVIDSAPDGKLQFVSARDDLFKPVAPLQGAGFVGRLPGVVTAFQPWAANFRCACSASQFPPSTNCDATNCFASIREIRATSLLWVFAPLRWD